MPAGSDSDVRLYLATAFGVTWLFLAPLALAGAGATERAVPGSLHLLGGSGPALAALLASRNAGIGGAWWVRIRHLPSGPLPWVLAAGIPLGLLGLGLGVVAIRTDGAPGSGAPGDPLLWAVVVSVTYGLLEEAGWRGYLLPRLQVRMGALAASVVVGGIHAVWHTPMFFYRYSPGIGPVLGFTLSLVAGSVVLTHLFNRSGGSVGVAVVFHAGWNIAILVGARGADDAAAAMSVGLMLFAAALVVRYGAATLAPGPAVRLAPGRSRSG